LIDLTTFMSNSASKKPRSWRLELGLHGRYGEKNEPRNKRVLYKTGAKLFKIVDKGKVVQNCRQWHISNQM
jgi:hypothetical protein